MGCVTRCENIPEPRSADFDEGHPNHVPDHPSDGRALCSAAGRTTVPVIYRSLAGQAAVTDAYMAWMKQVPTGAQSLMVPTRYGDAHVLTAHGPNAGPQWPAVLALPGTNFPALAWACLLAPPLRDYRVFAVDLVGQPGRSQGPRLGAVEAIVGWVDDVLDGLELSETTLVAHSLGGQLALRYAAARPHRTERLALICPAGLMRLRVPRPMLTTTIAWLARPGSATSRALLRQMSEPGHDVEDLVDWMSAVGRHVRISMAPKPLPVQVLHQVTCPVALVAGERDPFLPGQRLAKAAARRLPTASTVVIPGGCHLPPHDRPEQVVDLIATFLQPSRHG